MFLFRIIKSFVKFVFSLAIGIIFIVWLISTFFGDRQDDGLPYQDVTYMMTSYEKNAEFPRGTWCQCPVCDKYYYKDSSPCCSYKCEREYKEMIKAWNSAQQDRKYIENHGKKFK